MPAKISAPKSDRPKTSLIPKTKTAQPTVKRKIPEPYTGPTTTSKVCLKCGTNKDLNDYYNNKDWIEQVGKDCWCKECVNKSTTKEDIVAYFWYNNRQWNEKIWDAAILKAKRIASTNKVYINASLDRQTAILNRLACQQIPSVMQSYYNYMDNTKDGKIIDFEEAKEKGFAADVSSSSSEEKIYSKEFNGNFTTHDLEYLENYYKRLEEDFALDNESVRDYARKVCKASLQADKAQDEYAAGKIQFNDVKDALTQFDTLSKSANFAACKRKMGDTSGLTSWAETTFKLETTGHTMQRKIVYEQDDIDKAIQELSHIVKAIGLDSV